ncbi:AAA family ATPase [Candidatus Palauibacter sp.]|uniref:AAA family ATPase n=1 Tax=Candidatus Palauibacter sp. TaxID=3101350 RepID=UPI003B020D97
MSLIDRELREVWDALRARSADRSDTLEEVRIKRLRNVRDLRVPFSYPVSVLAGPNGCGKSTVLFSCACAYRPPGRGAREFVPSSLFPNFTSGQFAVSSDTLQPTELEFYYLHRSERLSMAWRRGKRWNRSFMGRKGGAQPERDVYLRTLANLTNPSEVRSVLQLGRGQVESETLTPDFLVFAHRILPWRYRSLAVISDRPTRDLLFAELDDTEDTRYSEFHMSSGERTILRISKDISELRNALVLIDEIDTGLHPYTQQQVMLELQRSALRQNLQIVVASHSSVVIESVPPEARIFFQRDDVTGEVRRAPLHRDIFQKALYGQSRNQLSILCEDAIAEGIIRGILDRLNVEIGLRHEDVVVGRDTGKDEFPGHIRTLGMFKKLADFIFVLDGDARDLEGALRAAGDEVGQRARLLFLPGEVMPEQWLWEAIRSRPADYANHLGISQSDLVDRMDHLQRSIGGTVQQSVAAQAARAALSSLAQALDRTPPEIARIAGRVETQHGTLSEFVGALRDRIETWRQL